MEKLELSRLCTSLPQWLSPGPARGRGLLPVAGVEALRQVRLELTLRLFEVCSFPSPYCDFCFKGRDY